MPFPPATPHANDTPMVWQDIATNIQNYRDYVNDVGLTDYGGGVIQREHLVKPVIQGFPSDSIESSNQGLWWRTYGLEEASATTLQEFATRARRLTVFPEHLSYGGRWTFPIGATFYLPTPSSVQIILGCEVVCRRDPAVLYPNGAVLLGSTVGGYLQLVTVYRPTNSGADSLMSRRDLYPRLDVVDPVRLGMAGSFADGTWDVLLQYVKDGSSRSIYQFDLGRVTMTIEAH